MFWFAGLPPGLIAPGLRRPRIAPRIAQSKALRPPGSRPRIAPPDCAEQSSAAMESQSFALRNPNRQSGMESQSFALRNPMGGNPSGIVC